MREPDLPDPVGFVLAWLIAIAIIIIIFYTRQLTWRA